MGDLRGIRDPGFPLYSTLICLQPEDSPPHRHVSSQAWAPGPHHRCETASGNPGDRMGAQGRPPRREPRRPRGRLQPPHSPRLRDETGAEVKAVCRAAVLRTYATGRADQEPPAEPLRREQGSPARQQQLGSGDDTQGRGGGVPANHLHKRPSTACRPHAGGSSPPPLPAPSPVLLCATASLIPPPPRGLRPQPPALAPTSPSPAQLGRAAGEAHWPRSLRGATAEPQGKLCWTPGEGEAGHSLQQGSWI